MKIPNAVFFGLVFLLAFIGGCHAQHRLGSSFANLPASTTNGRRNLKKEKDKETTGDKKAPALKKAAVDKKAAVAKVAAAKKATVAKKTAAVKKATVAKAAAKAVVANKAAAKKAATAKAGPKKRNLTGSSVRRVLGLDASRVRGTPVDN